MKPSTINPQLRLTILCGDAIEKLRELPAGSVHCCVTSPPYWGLRDYGTGTWLGGKPDCDHVVGELRRGLGLANSPANTRGGAKKCAEVEDIQAREVCPKCGARRIDLQIGLEPTPQVYVAKMVQVFREIWRVLRDDGTCWVNLGDSFAGSGKGGNPGQTGVEKQRSNEGSLSVRGRRSDLAKSGPLKGGCSSWSTRDVSKNIPCVGGLKPKDLVGIPWRVAFALQADGWYLRSDIIWHKQNCMPESVTDRPTKNHEYLFLLTKSARYFYDAQAIMEPCSANTHARISQNLQAQIGSTRANGGAKTNGNMKAVFRKGKTGSAESGVKNNESFAAGTCLPVIQRNKRTVWSVPSAAYAEAHFATYPPDLIKPCILAGTSAKGCCPDCGAPWERKLEVSGKATSGGSSRKHATIKNGQGETETLKTGDWNTKTDLGWQPTCTCHTTPPRGPGRPADPAAPVPCTVLDPFAGSGTTGQVALELGRKAILVELNPKYISLIERRTNVTPGLALA